MEHLNQLKAEVEAKSADLLALFEELPARELEYAKAHIHQAIRHIEQHAANVVAHAAGKIAQAATDVEETAEQLDAELDAEGSNEENQQ